MHRQSYHLCTKPMISLWNPLPRSLKGSKRREREGGGVSRLEELEEIHEEKMDGVRVVGRAFCWRRWQSLRSSNRASSCTSCSFGFCTPFRSHTVWNATEFSTSLSFHPFPRFVHFFSIPSFMCIYIFFFLCSIVFFSDSSPSSLRVHSRCIWLSGWSRDHPWHWEKLRDQKFGIVENLKFNYAVFLEKCGINCFKKVRLDLFSVTILNTYLEFN